MENFESKGFDFCAPQYIENLESAAFTDHEDDTFFDTIENEVGKDKICKTPERHSPVERFQTPCATMKELKRVEFMMEKIMEEKDEVEAPKKMVRRSEVPHKVLINGEERTILQARRRWSTNFKLGQIEVEDMLKKVTKEMKAKLSVSRTTFDGIELMPPPPGSAKSHRMKTRQDSVHEKDTIRLRGRSILRRENRKRRTLSPPTEWQQPSKYMTMAESIYHFEMDTPPRFHSTTKTPPRFNPGRLRPTIPNTPVLETKRRARKKDTVPQEERELKEIEEMRKKYPLAHPLNEKILKNPHIIKPDSGPSTVPEPFKLTQVVKKEVHSVEEKPFVFKANPVPKSTRQSIMNVGRVRAPIFKATNSSVSQVKAQINGGIKAVSNNNSRIPGLTNPYERGIEMLKKKEEKIKQILEEEKKGRDFQAKPLPSYLSTPRRNTTLNSTICSNVSTISSHSCIQKEEDWHFKAQEPSVLHKKPFEVKKSGRHLLEVSEFDLNTQKRAKEREEFNKKLKQKEEIIAIRKKQVEEEEECRLAEAVADLRKTMVHQATPLPQFIKKNTVQ